VSDRTASECCNVAYQVTWTSYFGWKEWIEFPENSGIRPTTYRQNTTPIDGLRTHSYGLATRWLRAVLKLLLHRGCNLKRNIYRVPRGQHEDTLYSRHAWKSTLLRNKLLQCSVARDLDSQIYTERMDWILRNTGHKAPTYRQIAGIALHRPVVQIPVFGLCLTI
jgi:hypothetical protein